MPLRSRLSAILLALPFAAPTAPAAQPVPIGTTGEQNFFHALELFQGQLVVVGDAVFIGPAPTAEYFR